MRDSFQHHQTLPKGAHTGDTHTYELNTTQTSAVTAGRGHCLLRSKSAHSYSSGVRVIVGRTEPITPPRAILIPSHPIFLVLAILLYVKHAPISLLFLIMAGKVYS